MKQFKMNYFAGRWLWTLAGATMAALLGSPVAQASIVTNVSVGDNFFSPKDVAISANDQVKWTWTGTSQHSSTSNNGLWESGLHSQGATFTHLFASAGSFPYHCTVHGNQVGTITVHSVVLAPPTVTIESPTNNMVLPAPATFPIVASANAPAGSVASVEFFRDDISLGIVTTSPYVENVTNLAAGSYTCTAVVTDNKGQKATNSVTLIVNALPTVAIVAPVDGATVAAPWSGSIQATASDADGTVTRVSFSVDGNPLGTVDNPAAAFSLLVTNLGAGSHLISAQAVDNLGGLSSVVSITLNVVGLVPATLSVPVRISDTGFQFSYDATPGLSYVVERSADLVSWTGISTNVATSTSVVFQDNNAPPSAAYYRVGLIPGL